VDNAIKYTPSGGRVHLSAKLCGKMAVFKVTDTGMGIPGDELPQIFDRFYRADQSRSLPGNGLGLSLAMAFAKAHNGNINIYSAPNQGTTCTFTLPLSAMNHF
ncbi:MAG: ATP-binding protein, partial [Desulfobacterales bacterium]|nr:ATP-binding protein [Desulfobacterales bacterium]